MYKHAVAGIAEPSELFFRGKIALSPFLPAERLIHNRMFECGRRKIFSE